MKIFRQMRQEQETIPHKHTLAECEAIYQSISINIEVSLILYNHSLKLFIIILYFRISFLLNFKLSLLLSMKTRP